MATSSKALYEDDRTWFWKFILRMLTIFLAAVGIGCLAWAFVTSSGGDEDPSYYDFYGNALVPCGLGALGLSILWNTSNIAVLFFRSRSIVPGANVGCDLVLWLLLFGTGTLLAISARDDISGYEYVYDGYRLYHHKLGEYGLPSNHRQGVVEAVGSVFVFVVMLCHFALFVSACRYTHQRRRARMTTQVREVVAELTRNGQLVPAQPPVSWTGHQSIGLSPEQSSPALVPEVLMQQQKSFAASGPGVQVPQQQQQQQQPAYPLTNTEQPSQALSPIQVQQHSGSWILPESMPNSAAYHLTTPGNDVEHPPSAEPVSPLLSPQSPVDQSHAVIHSPLSDDGDPSREIQRRSGILNV